MTFAEVTVGSTLTITKSSAKGWSGTATVTGVDSDPAKGMRIKFDSNDIEDTTIKLNTKEVNLSSVEKGYIYTV